MTALKIMLWAFASWVMSFVTPLAPFLVFTIILVFADLYTGTRAALKRGEQLQSRKLQRTVQKIVMYFVAILLSAGMEHVFFEPKGWNTELTFTVAALIALTELRSNLENIGQVTGTDFWNNIAGKLPNILAILKILSKKK